VLVYIKSWFTSNMILDAAVNDIALHDRINLYNDDAVRITGLKWCERHSWYLSPELASLLLFSESVSDQIKSMLVKSMCPERGSHRLTEFPTEMSKLHLSQTFFSTCGLDAAFLEHPTSSWSTDPSWKAGKHVTQNIPCVNASTRDEDQRQFLLQVVEEHPNKFSLIKGTRVDLLHM
jgi:hypothetical protein